MVPGTSFSSLTLHIILTLLVKEPAGIQEMRSKTKIPMLKREGSDWLTLLHQNHPSTIKEWLHLWIQTPRKKKSLSLWMSHHPWWQRLMHTHAHTNRTCSWLSKYSMSTLGDQLMQYLFYAGMQQHCAWKMTRLLLHRPELIILANCCIIGISGLIVRPKLQSESATCVSCRHWLARQLVNAPQHLTQAASLSGARRQCMTLCEQRRWFPINWATSQLACRRCFFFPLKQPARDQPPQKSKIARHLAVGMFYRCMATGKITVRMADDASEPKLTLRQVCWPFYQPIRG